MQGAGCDCEQEDAALGAESGEREAATPSGLHDTTVPDRGTAVTDWASDF